MRRESADFIGASSRQDDLLQQGRIYSCNPSCPSVKTYKSLHKREALIYDFKSQALALAESVGRAKAARQLDMSGKTLGNGLDASRAARPLSSPNRKPVSEIDSELARLRAENATLKMEREILKKAPAFFARESK
jgi:transposase